MSVRKEDFELAMQVITAAALEINTQDNLATADPIFMVQEKRETYSVISGEIAAEYWHNLQPFLTRRSAQAYIESNRHNLSEPRIYVESAYRNKEWIAIRTMIKHIGDRIGKAK